MNKLIVALLVVIGLLMQFRNDIRGMMGLAPIPAHPTAADTGPRLSLQEALEQYDQPEVVMYATPSCPYCQKARRYMDRNGISYREYNVNTSSRAASEMRAWGGRGVPTIVVANQEVLKGWHHRSLEQALLKVMLADPGQTP